MKKLVVCFALLHFVVFAFAQSINSPKVAEKLLPTTKQNVKAVMQAIGFTNIKMEKRAVEAAGGRVLIVCSGVYKGITPTCEVYFSDKQKPDMVSIQNNEWKNETALYGCYEKLGYTLVEHKIKPAHLNPERTNRAILRWAKQTETGNIICISEIADVVHDNSITMTDLNACFFVK